MNWINALILSFLIINFLTLLLVFYYVNRNWSTLLELKNYLASIDRNTWNNTSAIADINHKIKKVIFVNE